MSTRRMTVEVQHFGYMGFFPRESWMVTVFAAAPGRRRGLLTFTFGRNPQQAMKRARRAWAKAEARRA